MDERAGLSGLDFLRPVGGTAKAPIHRYKFPPQETELRGGEDLRNLGGDNLGKVDAISFEERTLDIKKRKDSVATPSCAKTRPSRHRRKNCASRN